MLTLYRNRDCPASDEIQQRLRELTLAHRIVLADDIVLADEPTTAPPSDKPPGFQSPTLRDGAAAYVGSQAILRHLEHLGQIKSRWDQFGADACYCDADGTPL